MDLNINVSKTKVVMFDRILDCKNDQKKETKNK